MGEDDVQSYMPASFGKQARQSNTQAQIDGAKRQVKPPKEEDQQSDASDKDSDDDGDDDDDDDEEDEFPVTHEIVVKIHEKAVTSIGLDPSGARMVTGSNDCSLKFHDFNSMTPTTIRAFKSVNPTATKQSTDVETHPVHYVSFHPTSPNQILVVTAYPQAKIFDREGEEVAEFVKGDMYLRDMNNTKGHISEISSGCWHPTEYNTCVTAGTDSTLRIWDVNNKRSQKTVIVHKSRAAGSAGRTKMTAVAWKSGILVGAALDGSLVMWNDGSNYTRPSGEIRDAHTPDTWTGGLDISPDGRMIVSRGGDDTIKLWDTRKFKTPIATAKHQSTSSQYPSSNIRFSPNGSNIITGSVDGSLHILSPALRPELVTPVTPGRTLITVEWHERLNQILTGSADGSTHVLFNPDKSQKGALTVLMKAPKHRHIDDDPNRVTNLTLGMSGDSVIVPGSDAANATSFAARHPNVGLTASGKSRDPRRPHMPETTPFAKSQPSENYLRDHVPLSSMRDEDPREALLKYQEKATKDPLFTNAWKETQPKTIYAELSDDEEGREKKKVKRNG